MVGLRLIYKYEHHLGLVALGTVIAYLRTLGGNVS